MQYQMYKKIDMQRDFRWVFYLSEAQKIPFYDPILPPPPTHGGGGGGELTREKVGGAIVHKAGRKYQHN